ncbi:MAG: cellulase family glycosylhydrolase [Mycolicibacterium cosmeticum]|nr:cellulase family glycosylhydrolase [Mycolicibacterium cosmeticum]
MSVPLLAAAVLSATSGVTAPPPASATASPRPVVVAENIALTTAIDTSSTTTGIAESSLYYMDQADLTTAMQDLQSMGVTQIRIYLPWRAMEPTAGTYSWTQADQLLDTAASYGIAVDAAITGTPGWATQYGSGLANGAPTSDADFASFVSAVASRYGAAANDGVAKIDAYEIWNEPNGVNGWFPAPDAAAYTALLKAAYTAIKAVDPKAEVIGGVLGAGITLGSLSVNPVTFLAEMYADGAEGFFDALAFHPYSTSLFSAGAAVVNSALQQLEALRALMNANGDALKLIWATEYGEASTAAGEANQAAFIQDFLTTWATLAGVGPSFVFSLIDSAYSGGSFGIFNSDWTPKEAVAVIKAWIAAHPVSGAVTYPVTQLAAAIKAIVAGINQVVSTAVKGVKQLAASLAAAVATLLKSAKTALGTKTTTTAASVAAVPAAAVATVTLSTTADTTKDAATDTATATAQSAETPTPRRTFGWRHTPATPQTASPVPGSASTPPKDDAPQGASAAADPASPTGGTATSDDPHPAPAHRPRHVHGFGGKHGRHAAHQQSG